MATMEAALARYPPTVASRCSPRILCDPTCPKRQPVRICISGALTYFPDIYTCDGRRFTPCYYPPPC
ncbi:hypothetical protein ANTPLA_LOCUS1302 [Anthophora plagiata]